MATGAWAEYYAKLAAQQQHAQQQQQVQQYAQYAQQYAAHQQQAQQHTQQQQQQQQQQVQQQATNAQGYSEEQRMAAWQQYYAQQAKQQQQQHAPPAHQPAANAGRAGSGPATGYNSYSQWYGTAATGTATAPSNAVRTQQQSGQVVGAAGTPAVTLSAASIAHAAVQAAAQCRSGASTSATPALTASGFQTFNLPRPSPLLQKPVPEPAPAPAAGGGGGGDGWPNELRKWVERAFAACKSDAERANVQHNLRLRIQRANETSTLWVTNWDAEPLPERSRQVWLPPPSSLADAYGRGGGASYGHGGHGSGREEQPLSKAAKKRKAKKAVNLYGGRDYEHDDDDDRGGGRGGGGFRADPFESAKRQRRLGRFDDGQAERPSNRWNHSMLPRVPTRSLDSGDGAGGDIDLDYTVVGTSSTVDKKYLRLTAAPDPQTVRPEPVLRQAIQMIKERYESYGEERGQEQYIFLWERMKAVRQDLTVQRIRNEFTVDVYEMHARICLEFDDRVEFQQCQAQLTQLYEEKLGTVDSQREFAAYNLLNNVGMGAHNNVADLMLSMTAQDRENEFIEHALKVRAAEALGDYTRLFRLYNSAPGHAQHVMDTFADRCRLDALRVCLKAYMPTVPLPFLTRNLGFENDDECAAFVEDHGVVVIEPKTAPKAEPKEATNGEDAEAAAEPAAVEPVAEPRQVDCKASRASLVEHSISARLEEEAKNAARKAEIVPISFS